mmetsp:Transcript_10656/g.22477  ORF Transcript_10656/g.22477 Transcript_10656/m.22477 type:complete len:594 (-) Transcript_10656:2051-3832(-)|eukprot:CAMPEP_0201118122 /NCGR_PEP_ID=MMETSP0850-20130426/2239_1 /ASSEMBLY_ACC=CAM_ASM_000622 /TAXON_ID=183588 /ORGANISM="Pseudo-nitzschia fraudulenta, Strain WWA7" /LENGTH=593 /DNA_ID=CAMNT_0047383079 /DNA_START=96 /DNA_END=1877 /DNA_ORIENTATION=-
MAEIEATKDTSGVACGVGAIANDTAYRSTPFCIDSLQNSLRQSISSKRGSMTATEIRFVQDMLDNESVEAEELKAMDDVLKCDSVFFNYDQPIEEKKEEEEGLNETERENPIRTEEAARQHQGSKKRLDYLEARKKQSAEQAKKRAALLWKKASVAIKAMAKLKNAPSGLAPMQLKEHPNDDVADEEDEDNETVPTVAADETEAVTEKEQPQTRKFFMRQASVNMYGGEGFEIGADDYSDEGEEPERDQSARTFLPLEASSDEGEENDRCPSTPKREMGFRRASFNIYGGNGFEVADSGLFDEVYDGSKRQMFEDYDPWLFQETDESGKRRVDFNILGTSHDDVDCHPHVLSPIHMDRLQPFLPERKKGESFWLKYSLIRDGASIIPFLKQVRASPCTLLAMETVDGEVFGGFFAQPWTIQPRYFGNGESFLWRMKHRRKMPEARDEKRKDVSDPDESLVRQIDREADLEIFRSEVYYCNDSFQLCHKDKIAAGGGVASIPQDFGEDRGGTYDPVDIGFGLTLGGGVGSLLEGTSSASMTFRNPPLSKLHSDGSVFELVNLEVWGFTPCISEEEARVLEYKNMFFKRHASSPI